MSEIAMIFDEPSPEMNLLMTSSPQQQQLVSTDGRQYVDQCFLCQMTGERRGEAVWQSGGTLDGMPQEALKGLFYAIRSMIRGDVPMEEMYKRISYLYEHEIRAFVKRTQGVEWPEWPLESVREHFEFHTKLPTVEYIRQLEIYSPMIKQLVQHSNRNQKQDGSIDYAALEYSLRVARHVLTLHEKRPFEAFTFNSDLEAP